MKNNKYWEDRANERMGSYHKNSDETILKINKAYDKAIKDINEDINNILINFKLSSKQSDKDVMQLLNSNISTKELDSIRNRINFITDEELKKYMLAQLNSRPYKARITRLEALKESIYINCKQIADTELKESQKLYTNNINNAYYQNTFDIQKGLDIGFNFATMPTETIEQILKSRWSGENYSKRVWHNTDVLADKLQDVITSGLMSGKGSKEMARELEDLSDLGKFAAERIIRTETTYVSNMAELESYKECGIDKMVYVATLDLRTSKRCRENDGNIVELDKAIPGENIPPLHPYCRSTTIAYFGEETLNNMKRRARNPETGKNEVVGNMSYDEWYKKYVDKDEIAATKIDKNNIYIKKRIPLTNTEYYIKEGTYIKGVKVFAKGLEIRDVDRLIKDYPLKNGQLTNANDWEKVRGTAILTKDGHERKAEVHWYQCDNIGKVEYKEKVRKSENKI